MEESRNFKLTNYQSEFVETFFNSTIKRDHILLAPAGSGKSLLTAVIIDKLISTGAQNILVLTSAVVLVEQYKYMFGEFVKSPKLLVLGRKTLREYEALKVQGYELTPMIAIGTWQTAIQEDVKKVILSTKWDLIVIDEVHFFPGTKPANLLLSIMNEADSRYKLLISNPLENANMKRILGEKYNGYQVTRWSREKLIASGTFSRPIVIRIVKYERTSEEVVFIRNYIKLSKLLSDSNVEHKVHSRLASSSLYAAEESLRNLRNQLVHGDKEIFSFEDNSSVEYIKDEELLGDVNISQPNENWSEPNIARYTELVTSTINSLDLVQVDSKFNALFSYLKENINRGSRVWIYTAYKSTISYLFSSLKEHLEKVYLIHGQMLSSDVESELQKFGTSGGILIASTNLITGVNLELDHLILYDVPESERLIKLLLSKAMHHANSGSPLPPLGVAIVSDTSAVLRSEKTREDRLVKISESIIGEEKNV